MPDTRPTKITYGELREQGVRGVLIYCSDYRCSHSTAISADQWPDDVRLSDIKPRFVCGAAISIADVEQHVYAAHTVLQGRERG